MKQPQSLRTKKTGWLRWWTHNRQASRQSKRPRRPKTRFVADVVPVAVEAEAVRADALFPVVAEPRQRAGLLTNVAFRVPAAGAEREELHQLTRVVLVRRPLGVVRPREPEQHRRIAGDGQQQVVEPPQPVPAEKRVLAEHQSLRADALVRRREPVVPDERHALDQWTAAAHHAVEPPEVVVAPGVPRREPAALVVPRRRPSEPLPPRRRQRLDGTVQALLREGLGLAAARTETGTPKQAFGLLWPEFAPMTGERDAAGCNCPSERFLRGQSVSPIPRTRDA